MSGLPGLSGPLRLEGPKVVLREFALTDTDGVAAVVGDDRVTHWLAFGSLSRDEAAMLVEGAMTSARQSPRTEYWMAMSAPGDDTFLGFARLSLGGTRAAELGYAIHADAWGRGYATAAVRLLAGFGFDALGLHRISAAIGPENVRSVGVVERLGFRLEGRMRDHVFTNGAWRDSLLFSVLDREWRAATS
ncbi:GNAT family protein [Kineosporia sp. NBRC 101731]|uniref:GNAT family N-acetyltransferase n=1 Tax=Kineosporia sp. NBRC 101731 TaxID=3032199 RepID=UPI0024A36E65|nr:GNAT family protein [Kineosporia sp. NBRC 101731]GLY31766.1 hypothetical protein Kisp02_51310 [Kineosporia sp. NBRC 101731]